MLWNWFHPTMIMFIILLFFHFLNGYIPTVGVCIVHVPKVIFAVKIWSWAFSMMIEMPALLIVSRYFPAYNYRTYPTHIVYSPDTLQIWWTHWSWPSRFSLALDFFDFPFSWFIFGTKLRHILKSGIKRIDWRQI